MARVSSFRKGDLVYGRKDRWKVVEELGKGGMGGVVIVQNADLGNLGVLKYQLADQGEIAALRDRFLREPKTMVAVAHEHVPKVFALDETEEGQLFFVMELLDGEVLRNLLRRKKRIEVDRVLGIGIQVLKGLAHIAEKGVIHRDIKPDNIFVSRGPDGRSVAKILDFGVVLHVYARMDEAKGLIGTADYAAPEQLEGKNDELTSAVDVFAMGITLFELLVGERPFAKLGGGYKGALESMRFPPPSLEPYGMFPPRLDALLQRAMAREPSKRPSANEMAMELWEIKQGLIVVDPKNVSEVPRLGPEAPDRVTEATFAEATNPEEPEWLTEEKLRRGESDPPAQFETDRDLPRTKEERLKPVVSAKPAGIDRNAPTPRPATSLPPRRQPDVAAQIAKEEALQRAALERREKPKPVPPPRRRKGAVAALDRLLERYPNQTLAVALLTLVAVAGVVVVTMKPSTPKIAAVPTASVSVVAPPASITTTQAQMAAVPTATTSTAAPTSSTRPTASARTLPSPSATIDPLTHLFSPTPTPSTSPIPPVGTVKRPGSGL